MNKVYTQPRVFSLLVTILRRIIFSCGSVDVVFFGPNDKYLKYSADDTAVDTIEFQFKLTGNIRIPHGVNYSIS